MKGKAVPSPLNLMAHLAPRFPAGSFHCRPHRRRRADKKEQNKTWKAKKTKPLSAIKRRNPVLRPSSSLQNVGRGFAGGDASPPSDLLEDCGDRDGGGTARDHGREEQVLRRSINLE